MISVERIEKEQWSECFSENAHRICFAEIRPGGWDRIDYALLATEDSTLYGYCTVRELDSESAYWQYGGAFPPAQRSAKAVKSYGAFVDYAKAHYKRVTTYVDNENITYLRLAFTFGFRAIGVRIFDGKIFVELLLDFTKEKPLCGL